MVEDFQTLVREFDLATVLQPRSPEQFMVNLVIVAILAAAAILLWKMLGRLI